MNVITLATVGIMAATVVAADNSAPGFVDSSIVENFFVRVYFSDTGGTKLLSTAKISYCVLTQTNETAVVYFPKLEYICQLELRDASGTLVPMVRKWKHLGNEFLGLKQYSWGAVNMKGRNTGGTERPDMTVVQTDKAQGRALPSPAELFAIKNSGEYKLSLQFQVFKLIEQGKSHTFRLVRFPSIVVPVVDARVQEDGQ